MTTVHANDSVSATEAVTNVVNDYMTALEKRDKDALMMNISNRYKAQNPLTNIQEDYTSFQSRVGSYCRRMANVSISDLKINQMDIQDNKATVEIEYKFSGLNTKLNMDVSLVRKAEFILEREGDSWKIIQIQREPLKNGERTVYTLF